MDNDVKTVASIVTIAALSLFLSIIPAFPIVGFSGAITLGALSGTLIGIFLKSREGLIAILLVVVLIPLINPGIMSILGFLYFLPLMLSWLSATLFFYSSSIYSLVLILGSLVVFVIVHGNLITYYPEYLIYDLIVPLINTIGYYIFYFKKAYTEQLRSIGAVINGIIGDHLGGSIAVSINSFDKLPEWIEIWSTAAWVYPVERTILIIIGILIVMPTIGAWLKFFGHKT
ncbi:MAG: hypothetical protein J7L82_00805 [Staphylothermus sp.]|nr:hypothetical protein [Staphylothermus sp.]